MAQSHGLGTVLAVLMAFAFGLLIQYVLKANDKREERLSSIISNHLTHLTEAIDNISRLLAEHDTRAREAIEEIKEANRRQREEHRELHEEVKAVCEARRILK